MFYPNVIEAVRGCGRGKRLTKKAQLRHITEPCDELGNEQHWRDNVVRHVEQRGQLEQLGHWSEAYLGPDRDNAIAWRLLPSRRRIPAVGLKAHSSIGRGAFLQSVPNQQATF